MGKLKEGCWRELSIRNTLSLIKERKTNCYLLMKAPFTFLYFLCGMDWPSRKQTTTSLLLIFCKNNQRKRKSLKPNNSETRPCRANWKAFSESSRCQLSKDKWHCLLTSKFQVQIEKKRSSYGENKIYPLFGLISPYGFYKIW